MPTPTSFNNKLIIWVDDMPQNNLKIIRGIIQPNIEVLQLTSTLMARKWTAEFGWLLNWMNVKFKVVSDMVRIENGVCNYEAGIDLLEHFYNLQGYSTPILIYCGNAEKAK